MLVAYQKAQGGPGFKRGTWPAKGVGMLVRYACFGGGCTRLAAETSVGYYWLGNLCKGLVANPCHSPKEEFKGLANPGNKGDVTCDESV